MIFQTRKIGIYKQKINKNNKNIVEFHKINNHIIKDLLQIYYIMKEKINIVYNKLISKIKIKKKELHLIIKNLYQFYKL